MGEPQATCFVKAKDLNRINQVFPNHFLCFQPCLKIVFKQDLRDFFSGNSEKKLIYLIPEVKNCVKNFFQFSHYPILPQVFVKGCVFAP